MKKIIECDIISFSHDHYLVFKNGKYHITNQPHYYGNLEFKFDDSELKRIKYISKEDKIKDMCLKTNRNTHEIIEKCGDKIEDFYKKNTSKFISSLIGDSVVGKLGKFFYNKSKVTKKIHKVANAIKTKNYSGLVEPYSSWLLVDRYNKHIEFLIDFSSLKENFEKNTQLHLQNKDRYLREGWKWSESKLDDIKNSYQNSLINYQNLINISNLYDIKLNFILDGVKECEFICVFKEKIR